jgi:hypothetical protein
MDKIYELTSSVRRRTPERWQVNVHASPSKRGGAAALGDDAHRFRGLFFEIRHLMLVDRVAIYAPTPAAKGSSAGSTTG